MSERASWEDNAHARLTAAALPKGPDVTWQVYRDPRDGLRWHVAAKRGDMAWNLRLTSNTEEGARAQVLAAMGEEEGQ